MVQKKIAKKIEAGLAVECREEISKAVVVEIMGIFVSLHVNLETKQTTKRDDYSSSNWYYLRWP